MSDIKPFRLIGNLYFVGTYEASSHLIDTGDGLILLDTGYERTAEAVASGVTELGFNMADVKLILHSHGHYDHTDATPALLTQCNAKTYLAREDIKYIKGWMPDFYYADGQEISLGNTRIKCLFTPGHTEGTYSFFFDVEENGEVYRVGTFGGASANQLKKAYLNSHDCSYLNRGLFFKSLEKLRKEHVDVFMGNHSWQNHTREKAELMKTAARNPFIDPTEWPRFLDACERKMEKVLLEDSRNHFVNYAHRGASSYAPENTFLSFYTGLYMGANGIETDVRMTRDGVLVLFHDKTIERVTGEEGCVADYTLAELMQFTVSGKGLTDKIVVFEDFLQHFAFRDITFAIEIKQRGIEPQVVDLLRKYRMEKKTVVTSFMADAIRNVREYAPDIRVGLLTKTVDAEILAFLQEIGAEEICPAASEITAEKVHEWHRLGFNVRAYGVTNEAVMKNVYDCMADGMTVNFPDKLTAYIQECLEKETPPEK